MPFLPAFALDLKILLDSFIADAAAEYVSHLLRPESVVSLRHGPGENCLKLLGLLDGDVGVASPRIDGLNLAFLSLNSLFNDLEEALPSLELLRLSDVVGVEG